MALNRMCSAVQALLIALFAGAVFLDPQVLGPIPAAVVKSRYEERLLAARYPGYTAYRSRTLW